MRIRLLAGFAALAVAGACAHGSTRSDTVSDEVLARVPPDKMGGVNQARLDVSKAKDTLARENLSREGQSLHRGREGRGRDRQGSDRSQRVRPEGRGLRPERPGGRPVPERHGPRAPTGAGRQLARQRSHGSSQKYSAARVNAAQKAVDLANARVEQAEFKAVQATGDPVVNNIDGQAIAKHAEDARVALEQQRAIVSQTKASASAARSSWIALETSFRPTSASAWVAPVGHCGEPERAEWDQPDQGWPGELQHRHAEHATPTRAR